jgi:hypothetical protein
MLRPHAFRDRRKVRLGRFYDGGYVMVDDFQGAVAAYSLGINDDVSWDLDIAALDIPVLQYDPYIEAAPQQHPLFTWRRLGLSGTTPSPEGFQTLQACLQSNGHEKATELILKCDIEGGEWELFANTPADVLRQFSQIVLEVHSIDRLEDLGFSNLARRALRNLTTHHRVVHVHANNWGGWGMAGGVPIPEAMELTLYRTDRGPSEPSDEIFPTSLDMPNHPDLADLYLGRFCFE